MNCPRCDSELDETKTHGGDIWCPGCKSFLSPDVLRFWEWKSKQPKRTAKLLIDFDNLANGQYVHLPVGSIVIISWVTQMDWGPQALCTSENYPDYGLLIPYGIFRGD